MATQARTAAISALENEYLAIGSNDAAAMDRLFTGAALVEMRQQRQHIRQLITDKTDYPGKKTLSNVQILSITSDYATTMTIDFTAHVRLANMKGSRTVDYSEADKICHVIVVQDDGAWKVSEVRWEYAPGSGP